MIKYLFISLVFIIFAKGIAGSHDLVTREKLIPPFPFNKDKVLERISDMTKRKTVSEVIRDFKKTHGNLYDYSLITEYNHNKQPLPIVCRKHGVFEQSANSHLKGRGCPICADEKTSERCRMKLDTFLYRTRKIHGDRYDYSLVTSDNFIDSHHKVQIICHKHGIFEQTPNEHLSGRGCYKCGKESMAKKQRFTREELIKLFNKNFDGKYDYSLFTGEDYKHKEDKIKVICPSHGVFEVSVDNHLYRHSGCKKCKSSLGEKKIAKYLNDNNIEFIQQYKIPNTTLLCVNKFMLVDFYLPKHNIIIEFNGIQHYKEIKFFNERTLDEQQNRDVSVRLFCKNQGIKLIEIPYTKINSIEKNT